MKKLSRSVASTLKIGRSISRHLKPGDIILLSGVLGAGKTVLAKGIAQGLGISKGRVVSPSFVLLRAHKGRQPLYHFDFYRLKSPRDILGLGYEEYFYADGVTVIEWPERLKFLLPKEFLKIKLSAKAADSRLLHFIARGAGYKRLLKKIDENIRD